MELKFSCDQCDAEVWVEAKLIGQQVHCPGCRTLIRVPSPHGQSVPVEAGTGKTGSGRFNRLFGGPLSPGLIGLAICGIVWLWQDISMRKLRERAAPLVAEAERMGTSDYLVGVGLESILRGAMGDPLGTAREQSAKESSLRKELNSIGVAYRKAANWKTAASWISLFPLAWICRVVWVWRSRYRRLKHTS